MVKTKLLDEVRYASEVKHLSYRTEQAYVKMWDVRCAMVREDYIWDMTEGLWSLSTVRIKQRLSFRPTTGAFVSHQQAETLSS